MKSEFASELKRVYDTVNDAFNALKNLVRRVDDDFVVAITEFKLDVQPNFARVKFPSRW